MTIRPLRVGDEAVLEAFLHQHADSSMFLRSNLRRAGLAYTGKPYEGRHLAAFEGGAMVGVIAGYWNGNVVVQAPRHARALAEALAQDGEAVAGLLGPEAQVRAILPVLAPNRRAQKDSAEILFGLDLDRLVMPPLLASGRASARLATPAEHDLLARWRHDYYAETFDAAPGPALMERARADFTARGDGSWLLYVDGEPVASQSFNASLPDIVQVGGVWTPPALRGRGYARSVVAAALADARARGVRRAILFTGRDNVPAQRVYHALGFTPIGDYALVLFAP